MRAIVDIEADGLLDTIKNIWCIVCKDVDTGQVYSFTPDNMADFKQFSTGITEWIGHNFINYDARAIDRILGIKVPLNKITDTLVLSRIIYPIHETGGGHSLEDWGERLGFPKMPFTDWSHFSNEMLEYCKNDIELNFRIYQRLMKESSHFSKSSLRLEHNVRYLLDIMQDNGFKLDEARAQQLYVEIDDECKRIEEQIQKCYPNSN